jgi:hypothetical protein
MTVRRVKSPAAGRGARPEHRSPAPQPHALLHEHGMTRAGNHWCPDCEQQWSFVDNSIGPQPLVPAALLCPECATDRRSRWLEAL